MKQTFTYKEKFAFSYFYPAITFIVLAIATGIFKYGIRFKNLSLLDYPNSLYILGVCAVIFIVYAFYKYNKAQQSAKNPHHIEITGTGLSFPKGSSENISVGFVDVNELWTKEDKDDGKQVIIYVHNNKDRYEFSEDKFDNAGEFAKFETLMRQNCTNITK